jgi:DNA-binding transcriptional LysR family regulator
MTPFKGKLRIRHLEIVLMVADQGSLSKAASQLRMTQSGLSRAIAEVEECVDGRLFERSTKGMVCTPLGLAMCRHAGILLSDFGKAEADLAAVSRGELGSLTVGCFAMFSGWPLAEAVRAFRETHPQVALTIQIGTHERLIEDLDSGALDVLISRYTSSLDPLIYRSISLLNDNVVLTCAAGHPLAASPNLKLADCARYPWLTALSGGPDTQRAGQHVATAQPCASRHDWSSIVGVWNGDVVQRRGELCVDAPRERCRGSAGAQSAMRSSCRLATRDVPVGGHLAQRQIEYASGPSLHRHLRQGRQGRTGGIELVYALCRACRRRHECRAWRFSEVA